MNAETIGKLKNISKDSNIIIFTAKQMQRPNRKISIKEVRKSQSVIDYIQKIGENNVVKCTEIS